ncbi:MAG: hypothetical protein Q7O66_20655, partial [Dehalococcoidia bacterium]|nr:hypothetical protein [Dehalococcoidia bacterium]
SLWDLESWLAPRLRVLFDNPESPDGQLAGIIELCLAEVNANIRTERSVRTILSRRLPSHQIVYMRQPGDPEETTTTGSSSVPNLTIPEWVIPSQAWSSGLPRAV